MKCILPFFAALLILWSCNTSDDLNNSCVLNNITISGAYKIVSEKVQADSLAVPYENISNWAECERDNIYDLMPQGTFLFTEGTVSCTNPPLERSGNWSLSGDTLLLNFSTGMTERIVVSGFNCYSFNARNRNPVSGEIRTITYQKQN